MRYVMTVQGDFINIIAPHIVANTSSSLVWSTFWRIVNDESRDWFCRHLRPGSTLAGPAQGGEAEGINTRIQCATLAIYTLRS